MRPPLRALAVGLFFCIVSSYIFVLVANRVAGVYLPATQISCISIIFVLFIVVLINPILKRIRLPIFTRKEIFLIYIMATVPAGLPFYGYVCRAIPYSASLHNPEWNTPQSGWDETIVPNLDGNFFVSDKAAIKDYIRGLQARNSEAFPVFVKKPTESFSEWKSRFWRFCTVRPDLCEDDIKDWRAFYPQITRGSESEASILQSAIWRRFPKELQSKLLLLSDDLNEINRRDADRATSITCALQTVLSCRDFYQKNDFDGVQLPAKTKQLLEAGCEKLSTDDIAVLNRSLLEAVYSKKALSDWRALSIALCGNDTTPYPAADGKLKGMLTPEVWETIHMTCATMAKVADYKAGVVSVLNEAISDPNLQGAGGGDSNTDYFGRNRLLVEQAFPGCIRTYDIKFMGNVPWAAWTKPLLAWGLLAAVLCLLFYTLNELVFKQWHEREKLIFPIAQLATIAVDPEEGEKSCIPRIFTMPLFWLGFAISFSVLFYNGMIIAHWIKGMDMINIRGLMDSHIEGTVLEGLTPGFRLEIIFTVVGLAFLLPLEISFSVWFFFVLMKAQQLIAVWLGHGNNGASFSDPNFMTAQGGGAMIIFGLVVLWKVRRPILAFLYRLAYPNGTASFSKEEIRSSAKPSFIFLAASVAVIYFMRLGNVDWGMCILSYILLLIMAITIIRLVAECGLLGACISFGPIEVIKIFGLLSFPLLFTTKGLPTIAVLLAAVFPGLSTFVAAPMLNAKCLAVRKEVPARYFGLSVFLGLVITLVAASIVALVLVYDQGIFSMDYAFHTGPKNTFMDINAMVTNPGQLQKFDPGLAGWMGVGAASCAFLIYFRQFIFWMPHPIGLVMFVNPLTRFYWFSFLLAWVLKRAAIKYCNADSYKSVRAAFIGLIIGEVAAIGISVIFSLMGMERMGLSLDRSW